MQSGPLSLFYMYTICAYPEGSNSDIFLVGEGREDPNAYHHRPASETLFKWHFAGGSMIANIECWLTSIAKKTRARYSFVIFQGRGPDPRSLPLDPRMSKITN